MSRYDWDWGEPTHEDELRLKHYPAPDPLGPIDWKALGIEDPGFTRILTASKSKAQGYMMSNGSFLYIQD